MAALDTCLSVLSRGKGYPRYEITQVKIENPQSNEILIRVKASGVNYADIEQSKGEYPPPKKASLVLGLEVAGVVEEVGSSVTKFKKGDRVMALVTSGAYSEYCVAPIETTLPIPEGVSFEEAAAIPESYFTLWSNVWDLGSLKKGEFFLVHGGSSGVGSSAIQLAKQQGAIVITTARNQEKCEFCKALGADLAIEYTKDDFQKIIEENYGKQSIDVILDTIGAIYLTRHLELLKRNGRLVFINSLSGDVTEIDLGLIMVKNLTVRGSLLRPRPLSEKKEIADNVLNNFLPWVSSKAIVPKVARTFALREVEKAHQMVERSEHMGKVVLVME